MSRRTVFFISDHTGITVEKLGNSLLSQFDRVDFNRIVLPFLDTEEKAQAVRRKIDEVYVQEGFRPIVFSTLTEGSLRAIIAQSEGLLFDLFDTFLGSLERELEQPASHSRGKAHGIINRNRYKTRIDAVKFALNNDDGANIKHYGEADAILVGVSRTGKTPACLYLALQYGVYAANYPLTDEVLEMPRLPAVLKAFRQKLFGLTADPESLHHMRQERRPDSRYASLKQCQKEIAAGEELFQMERIPSLNTTLVSVEEIATKIVHEMGLKKTRF